MSIRKLFEKQTTYSIFSESPENIRKDAESLENVSETWKNKTDFIPQVDFSDPANFVKYGSAKSYYEDSITRIYENYPYDGSSKERQEYLNESTYIDLWMLQNKYPRTNGFVTISAEGWGNNLGFASGYGSSSIEEYISFFGGPNTASQGMSRDPLSETFGDSNLYDEDIYDKSGFTGTGTRESNLKTNFDNGVTIEFWLKKEQFDDTKTKKEVIFDLWNGAASSDASYGRILLQLTGTSDNNFLLSVQSGTLSPYEEAVFGADTTPTTLQTFGHYAFRIYNDTSPASLKVDYYKNGQLLESKFITTPLGEVTGALQANLGALTSPAVQNPGGSAPPPTEIADRGWGKLSGSLDEFRFWKSKRSSEQIGRYWFDQVYGGTNTDISNADLGVYFKFNEGITGNSSIDSTVLDYSGRITNGNWTGYNSSSRNTGSAMVLAGAASSEFKDPIIYDVHPLVIALTSEMQESGSNYDFNNTTALYNSYPTWIIEEDESSGEELKRLTQIMSSFLDTLYLQIDQLNKVKDIKYPKQEDKNITFANRLLEGYGFVAPEIFADSNLLNQIFDRAENKKFDESLLEIKNSIYKNIYNNIVSIYKSKGTSRAFRNLVRCYGIDERLVRVNAYANNITYNLEENRRYTSSKKNFIDFYKTDNFYGTIYQTASSDSSSRSFISASQGDLEDYTSFTLESEVIFPTKRTRNSRDYYPTPFNTSSLFGFHTADPANPTDYTWAATDYDIQVYAVRPERNSNLKNGYFLLTSSYYGIEETTDTIENLYNNGKWNLSLTLSPEKIDSDLVSGSADTNYVLKLYAINTYSDVVQNEITLQTTIDTDGDKLLSEPKRIYAATHRQNFTGSVIHGSDVKMSAVRYWMTELDDTAIKNHAIDTDSFGPKHPLRNVHNFVSSISDVEIPQLQTLALHWSFDQVTGSDNGSGIPTTPDAGFNVIDNSSGSIELRGRYSWLGNVIGSKHPGRGDFFYPNTTNLANTEFIPVAKQENPEIVSADNTINILNLEEQEVLTRNTRPVTFTFMAEKSMYAAITSEIINYFSSILDFNNLIGDPVNRYRQEYKSLGKLRQLFFEKVQNEPDVERYLEYYKWIDNSLGEMLMELFPASAQKQDGLRNIIESHILERNKYWNKYPTVDLKQEDPEAGARGINELTYNWNYGHHPVSGNQNESCFWWKERAERDKAPLASGDSGVDSDKSNILSATLSVLTRKYSTPYKFGVERQKVINTGLTKDNNISQNVKKSVVFGSTDGLLAKESDVKGLKDCVDDSSLNIKKKFPFELENQLNNDTYASGEGDYLSPFTAVSSSVQKGYQKSINDNFKNGFGITNLHIDSYVDNDVPLQGPFTEKFVGGNQHRHVDLNKGADNASNRPEAWSLQFQSSPNAIKFVHQPVDRPRAMLRRGLVAKSPLNISNIKTNTDSYGIGNYSKEYEIVQTVSRTKNNSSFVKAGGYNLQEFPSPYIAGVDDYEKPERGKHSHVFVNRFSSPGEPSSMGDSNGGPGLDTAAAEFSPYATINYRNTTTRDVYRLLLASHVNQFGFYSDVFNIGNGPSEVNDLDYAGTASIYQVNRNTIKQMKDSESTTITASVYDNFFVQHQIPRTDLQYSWLTSSVLTYDTFGLLPYDSGVDLVTFSSASDFISQKRNSAITFGKDQSELPTMLFKKFVPTTYNWMNLNSKEPVSYSDSFIGYTPDDVDLKSYLNETLISNGLSATNKKPMLLNSVLLRRNGPYQHPTWKQTRGYENPVVKKWNSSNITAYNLDNGSFKLRDDSPVISKYKPVNYTLRVYNQATAPKGGPDKVSIRPTSDIVIAGSFGNDITLFSNKDISVDLNINNDGYRDSLSSYARITKLYLNDALDNENNPVQSIKYVAYGEQIYPSPINMYSKRNRERIGYKNTFWRDDRQNRSALGEEKFGGTNSQGYAISQSAWVLDTSEQFGTEISTFVAPDAATGKAGELQNDYTIAWSLVGSVNGAITDINPAPLYARKHTMGSCYSVINPRTIYQWTLTGSDGDYVSILAETGTAGLDYLCSNELMNPMRPLAGLPLVPQTSSWPGNKKNNLLGHVSIFGGNAKFEAHEQAGYVRDGAFISSPSNPFYDKYELYAQNMRLKNKDMSLVPEFRISEHVEKYLKSSDGIRTSVTGAFSIFGVNENNTENVSYTTTGLVEEEYTIKTSKDVPQNSSEDDFYRIYSFSDFMENFEIVSDDHDKYVSDSFKKSLTLSCKALKKFIAYDGFYPSERTTQIAEEFTNNYNKDIKGSLNEPGAGSFTLDEAYSKRPIYATLFSPGVLFNTIKSGMAVDFPVHTSSFEIVRYYNNSGSAASPGNEDYSDYYAIGTPTDTANTWGYRVPFEALLEPELLNDKVIYDMEPHPSASLSQYELVGTTRNTTRAKITGIASDDKTSYKLAINNFLAETANMFLEDSRPSSLISKKSNLWKGFKVGETYGLRLKMRRSMQGFKANNDYPVPQEYLSSTDAEAVSQLGEEGYRMATLNMYSRPTAFGPPVAGTSSFNSFNAGTPESALPRPIYLESGSFYSYSAQSVTDSLYGYNPSYTPPYYDGESWLDILYTPTTASLGSNGLIDISDIFANSEKIYWRIDGADDAFWPSGQDSSYPMHKDKANDYAMQLSSSLNPFNKAFEKAETTNPAWEIQMKFETPILNFGPFSQANYSSTGSDYLNNVTLPIGTSEPWSGSCGKTTTPIGMWHQFGTIPTETQGIYIEIADIEESWLANRATQGDISETYKSGEIRSLNDIVGFSTNPKKLGVIAQNRSVFEAVVAIPFVENEQVVKTSQKLVSTSVSRKSFFQLPITQTYSSALDELMSGGDSRVKDLFPSDTDESVIEMAEKIKDRYVFPPQFDFFRNKDVKPIAMYIFDFEHVFDRDDLSYIWQNIAPKIGNQFMESVSTISHPLLEGQILDEMKDKVKWMVFKVKQRAKTKYKNLLVGNNEQEELFSPNWPYDYFSLIEFAKIDSTVSYGELVNVGATYLTSSTTGLPPALDEDLSRSNASSVKNLEDSKALVDSQVQAARVKSSKKIKN